MPSRRGTICAGRVLHSVPWSISVCRSVRIARLGLMRSIHSSDSSRLKWLGCGGRRSASTIQTSSPASASMLSGGSRSGRWSRPRCRSESRARRSRRGPEAPAEPRSGRPARESVTGVPGTSRCSIEHRRIAAAGRGLEAVAEAAHGRRARSARPYRRRPCGALLTNSGRRSSRTVGMVGVLVGDQHARPASRYRRRSVARAGRSRRRPERA